MQNRSVVKPLVARTLQKVNRQSLTVPSMEPVYQRLVERDLQRAGIPDEFYPVGAAANYSLLYLILRIAFEFHPASVLDIGAGQSSILWSRLLKAGTVRRVLTVEDNAEWASVIGPRLETQLMLSPLATEDVAGRTIETYDWKEIASQGPYDVIVCDGPWGVPRYSRFGVLNVVDDTLPEDFIIVLDDAERPGEQDTEAAIVSRLDELKRSFRHGHTIARKRQAIIAGGQYRRAADF